MRKCTRLDSVVCNRWCPYVIACVPVPCAVCRVCRARRPARVSGHAVRVPCVTHHGHRPAHPTAWLHTHTHTHTATYRVRTSFKRSCTSAHRMAAAYVRRCRTTGDPRTPTAVCTAGSAASHRRHRNPGGPAVCVAHATACHAAPLALPPCLLSLACALPAIMCPRLARPPPVPHLRLRRLLLPLRRCGAQRCSRGHVQHLRRVPGGAGSVWLVADVPLRRRPVHSVLRAADGWRGKLECAPPHPHAHVFHAPAVRTH